MSKSHKIKEKNQFFSKHSLFLR